MQPWLLILAAAHSAAGLGSELKDVVPGAGGHMNGHSVDFRLGDGAGPQGLMFRQIDLDRQIAPDAQIGVGMPGSSAATKGQFQLRDRPPHRGSGGPTINFVLKF
jgi:hypothetical protein